MFVKPKLGCLVRDPVTKRHLPAEGKEVPENTYWIRRLYAGDVLLDSAPLPVVQNVQITDYMPDEDEG